MKHLFPVLLLCLFVMGCSSKSKDEPAPPAPAEITISQMSYIVSSSEQQITMDIKSTVGYSIFSDAPWCSVSSSYLKKGESSILIKLTENTSYDERKAHITVEGEGIKKSILVTQKQKDAILLSNSVIDVDAASQNCQIDLRANVQVNVAISEEGSAWIKPVATRGLYSHSFKFTVEENKSVDERSAEITFSSGSIKEKVTLRQKGAAPYVEVSPNRLSLEYRQQVVKVAVRSNTIFKIIEPRVEWMKILKEECTSEVLCLSVDSNLSEDERKASITLIDTKHGTETELVITQAGKEKDRIQLISGAEIRLTGGASEENIEFKTNADWSVSTEDYWIHPAPVRGKAGQQEVRVKVDSNTGPTERRGKVLFSAGTARLEVSVVQDYEHIFQLLNDRISIPFAGGECCVEVNSTDLVEYEITEGGSWLEFVRKNTYPNEVFVFRAKPNSSTQSRTGWIQFVSHGQVKRVCVEQEGADPVLEVLKNRYEEPAAGGEISVDVISNLSYIIQLERNCDWITCRSTSGNGDKQYKFVIKANKSMQERQTTIMFATKDGRLSVEVTVVQKGRKKTNPIDDMPVENLN